MYILGEYAFFALVAVGLVSLLLIAGAIGYLARAIGIMCARSLRTAGARPAACGDAVQPGQLRLRPWTLRQGWASAMRPRAARGGLAAAALVIAALILLPHGSRAQQATPSAAPDDPYTINVRVDEVLLHVTVRNRGGTPVTGLGKDAFRVFEDGVPQRIQHFGHAEVPATVGLVIDNSGSMGSKRAEVIAAALAFADSSNPHDQMFLVNFNERVSFGLPEGMPFTDQRDRLRAAMASVTADGKTALYDAVAAALEHLKRGNLDKKVLIVVSDGADNASAHTREQVLSLAAESGAIIYGIGVYEPGDPENRHPRAVLRQLAKASGGEAFFPYELREVLPRCERIAREIRTQYTLSYIPSNQKQDGTYRAVEVRASRRGGGLSVTTRAGYRAPQRPATAAANQPEARN